MNMHRLKLLAVSLLTIGSVAGANCVNDLNYPQTLQLPTLERWAKADLFESASPNSECKMAKELIELFDGLEKEVAKASPDKRRLRGTHSKGVCLRGQFKAQYDAKMTDAQKELLK